MAHEQEQDKKLNTINVCMAELKKDIAFIKEGIGQINTEIRSIKENYVSKEQFKPVQKIAYGFVGVVGTLLITIISYLIINR